MSKTLLGLDQLENGNVNSLIIANSCGSPVFSSNLTFDENNKNFTSGYENQITGQSTYSSIISGRFSCISDSYNSTIIGGEGMIGKPFRGLTGGSCISGGRDNFITGGLYRTQRNNNRKFNYPNRIESSFASSIIGGASNCIYGSFNSSIISGRYNTVCYGRDSSIIGGSYNCAYQSTYSTIIGGYCNRIYKSNYSAIIGGAYQNLYYQDSTVSVPKLFIRNAISPDAGNTYGVDRVLEISGYTFTICRGIIVSISP